MRHLDIHDHQVGDEQPRPLQRLASVGHGFDRETLAAQDVAEQFAIEVVVLDNQDALCHGQACYEHGRVLTILRDRASLPDPRALALSALGWLLADEDRAQRLLALTGLTPDDLRARLGEDAVLGAVLDFLCAHEPDLVAAAHALGVDPATLAAARAALSGEDTP
jgi:hypothetical protein